MAIAFVRQAVGTIGSGTSLPVTILPAAAGNSLVLVQTGNLGRVTSIACTNVTWVAAKQAPFNQFAAEIWLGLVAGGASGTVVTLTLNGSTYACSNVSEWSGLKTSGAISNVSGADGTSTAPSSGSATPSAAPALCVAVMAHNNGGTVSSGPTGGFTALDQAIHASTMYAETGFQIQSSVAAAASTAWTLSASTNWETSIATFLGDVTGGDQVDPMGSSGFFGT